MAEVYTNKLGLKYEIVERAKKYSLVRFIDTNQFELLFNAVISRNVFLDHSQPFLYGVGYATGTRENPLNFRENEFYHKMWSSMITRCYRNGGEKNYKDVAVCPEWQNYTNFLEWAQKQMPTEVYGFSRYALDKDIFSLQENCKMYSPATTCIITNSVNSMAVGLNFLDYSQNTFKRVERLKERVLNAKELGKGTIERIAAKIDKYFSDFEKNAAQEIKEDVKIYESVELTAFIEYKGKLYKFTDTRQLQEFAKRIEQKQPKE